MGWETGVTSLVGAFNSFQSTNQASATANAQIKQGEYEAANIADNTVRKAGTLQTSFLQSGIVLDSASQASQLVQQAFAKGTTDIGRTLDNANNAAANTMSAARTKALQSLGSSFSALSAGGNNSPLNQAGSYVKTQSAYALNDMGYGNTAYDMLDDSSLDPSPVSTLRS